MRNLTPSHLRCGTGLCPSLTQLEDKIDMSCAVTASCPSVTELTPEHLRCGGSASSCSSVKGVENDLLIVGKRVSDDLIAAADAKVGPDEVALRIGSEYFADYIAQHVDAAVRAEREAIAKLADDGAAALREEAASFSQGDNPSEMAARARALAYFATAIRSRGKDNG
jgi:hypothetical protein